MTGEMAGLTYLRRIPEQGEQHIATMKAEIANGPDCRVLGPDQLRPPS
jgi:hypothetical protein